MHCFTHTTTFPTHTNLFLKNETSNTNGLNLYQSFITLRMFIWTRGGELELQTSPKTKETEKQGQFLTAAPVKHRHTKNTQLRIISSYKSICL